MKLIDVGMVSTKHITNKPVRLLMAIPDDEVEGLLEHFQEGLPFPVQEERLFSV